MKTRQPHLGLLKYSFHSASGSLALTIVFALMVGIIAQITEIEIVLQLFPMYAIGSVPYIVMSKSGGIAKWEQYLLATPIKRKNLVTSLYLNVFIALLLAIPILGIVWSVGSIVNNKTLEFILLGNLSSISLVASIVLLMAALLYPIGSTKIGGRSEQAIFIICLIIATAIVAGFFMIGNNHGLSDGFLSLTSVSATGTAFIVSMFITRALYAKIDF